MQTQKSNPTLHSSVLKTLSLATMMLLMTPSSVYSWGIVNPITDDGGTSTSDGSTDDTSSDSSSSENTEAVANAGSDQTSAEGDDVLVDGSASSDDSDIKTYTWTLNGHSIDGEKATLPDEWFTLGENTVTLSVEANDGDTDSDEMVVTVLEYGGSADDLCYEESISSGMFCMDMGVCSGGLGCTNTYPIKNIGEDNISSVHVVYDETGMGASMFSDCGVSPDGTCSQESDVNFGPMGVFGQTTTYQFANAIAPEDDDNNVWAKNLFSMSCMNGEALYGTYVKEGKYYRGALSPCVDRTSTETSGTGPFDSWDTNRNVNDRNISTKVVNNLLTLTVAHLNSDNTATQANPEAEVKYRLIDRANAKALTRWQYFNGAVAQRDILIQPIPTAHKEVFMQFKFCQDKETHDVVRFSQCSDSTKYDFNTTTRSSDGFAIRPNNFTLTLQDDANSNLLRAGQSYNYTLKAVNAQNKEVEDYNQTKANLYELNATKELYFADDSLDTEGQLKGALSYDSSVDFNMTDGISTDASGANDVVAIQFSDVAKVKMHIEDHNWAAIDADDTPQDCSDTGAFICGESEATFIPDHFSFNNVKLINHNNGDFTYFSNDLNMSAHVEATIEAKNAQDATTLNFSKEANFYENPVSVAIVTPTTNKDGVALTDTKGDALESQEHNISQMNLGFTQGSYTITWNESNESKALFFNYKRANDVPVNPSVLAGADLNVTATSLYTDGQTIGGVEIVSESAIVTGNAPATQEATLLYARATASQYLYDDVLDNTIETPILVEVYCDKWPASASTCPQVDVINGDTNEHQWWIATAHNSSNNDGNLSLTIENGELSSNVPSLISGIDDGFTVTGQAPNIAKIDLDSVNSWLVYNKESATQNPSPFYQVHFIYGDGTWTGSGKTGHVVDDDINTKKTRRLEF